MRTGIKTAVKHACWSLVSKVWWACPGTPALQRPGNNEYSISVVTYINRYEKFFRPLIRSLCALFPDTEIIVTINGYYDRPRQMEYLKRVADLLDTYPNVSRVEHMEGQSLSKLWNQSLIESRNKKLFVFNDDLIILPSFRRHLEASGIIGEELALINRSWSHFLISKRIVSEVGWFDERFPGVGNEDEDFEARLVHAGLNVKSFTVQGLRNVVFKTRDFSYGKHTKTINVKYVRANKAFFDKKWELSDEKLGGSVFVPILGQYARLREGMDTPNFYPDVDVDVVN